MVYLARHGETAWSVSGQHTGLTDLPLTPQGERNGAMLGARLRTIAFARVFTSPLLRASRTCALAGFGAVAQTDPDLVEWDYGQYEGMRSVEIRAGRPGWELFRDGCPGGESVAEVVARADRVVARFRSLGGNILVFTSGHFLRMIAARWIGLDPVASAARLVVSTASLSALGFEHDDRSRPVIRFWNETTHLDV